MSLSELKSNAKVRPDEEIIANGYVVNRDNAQKSIALVKAGQGRNNFGIQPINKILVQNEDRVLHGFGGSNIYASADKAGTSTVRSNNTMKYPILNTFGKPSRSLLAACPSAKETLGLPKEMTHSPL